MTVDGAFAKVLERHRERYNGRFAHARRIHRSLEPDDFSRHLVSCVAPAVNAVAEQGADAAVIDAVSHTLYDLSLELVASDFAGPGARYPVMSRMWAELLPIVPGYLIEAPRDFVGALSNAIFNLSAEPTIDEQEWLDRMLDLHAQVASREEFLSVGMVLAWRLGMAHYRASALERWRELPEPLQVATLGVSSADDPGEDRWRTPGSTAERSLNLVGTVGGFRGFDGPFDAPPEVMQVDGRLFVFDNTQCWSVHADCFGATIRPFGKNLPEGRELPAALVLAADGTARFGELTRSFEVLAGATSCAASRQTLVATTPRSHRVFIVASTGGGRA